MPEDTVQYRSIGIIRSEHLEADKTPIQPAYVREGK